MIDQIQDFTEELVCSPVLMQLRIKEISEVFLSKAPKRSRNLLAVPIRILILDTIFEMPFYCDTRMFVSVFQLYISCIGKWVFKQSKEGTHWCWLKVPNPLNPSFCFKAVFSTYRPTLSVGISLYICLVISYSFFIIEGCSDSYSICSECKQYGKRFAFVQFSL